MCNEFPYFEPHLEYTTAQHNAVSKILCSSMGIIPTPLKCGILHLPKIFIPPQEILSPFS